MNINAIKGVIRENPRVILYFGSDCESFIAVTKATGGFIPAHIKGYTELCLLYANGKYDGFNRDGSIEFFKMDFSTKTAYYKRWVGLNRDQEDEWLLVDLSHERRARIV